MSDASIPHVDPLAYLRGAIDITKQQAAPLARHEAFASAERSRIESKYLRRVAPAYYRNITRFAPEIDRVTGELMGGLDRIGASDIEEELQRQAFAELRLGRTLSNQEKRDAAQSAREAFASRGMLHSNPAVAAEILNRDEFGRQRESQRRAFATGVDTASQQRELNDRSYVSSTFNQAFASLDPYRRIFGGYSQQGFPQGLAPSYQAGAAAANTAASMAGLNAQVGMHRAGLDFQREQLATEVSLAQQQMRGNLFGGLLGGGMALAGTLGGANILKFGSILGR